MTIHITAHGAIGGGSLRTDHSPGRFASAVQRRPCGRVAGYAVCPRPDLELTGTARHASRDTATTSALFRCTPTTLRASGELTVGSCCMVSRITKTPLQPERRRTT